MDLDFALIDKGGTLGCLFTFVLGGVRQWWVFGHQYVEMRTDRDQWRAIALSGHDLNKQAVGVFARKVSV